MSPGPQVNVAEPHLTQVDATAVVVHLTGEIDREALPSIEDYVVHAADGCDRLVIDVSRVTYLDSAGVRGLDGIARTLAGHGVRIGYAAGARCIARRVLGIAHGQEPHETVDEALASLEG